MFIINRKNFNLFENHLNVLFYDLTFNDNILLTELFVTLFILLPKFIKNISAQIPKHLTDKWKQEIGDMYTSYYISVFAYYQLSNLTFTKI